MFQSLQSMFALFFFFNDALINADQRLVFQFETEWLTKAEVKRFKRTSAEASVSFLIVITASHNPASNAFFFFFFFNSCVPDRPDNKWSRSPSSPILSLLFPSSQGLLSFLSAPLIGALSDVWGRKSFLLLTVFFTCAPIPLMKISPWWGKTQTILFNRLVSV